MSKTFGVVSKTSGSRRVGTAAAHWEPKPVEYIQGSLLSQPGTIVVPANCTKVGTALGITGKVYTRYPEANTYRTGVLRVPSIFRIDPVLDPLPDGPDTVVSIYGQYNPGPPDTGRDSVDKRLGYFRTALFLLDWPCRKYGWTRVSFPASIFCGVAGGNWADYEEQIKIFASDVPAQVVIVKEGSL